MAHLPGYPVRPGEVVYERLIDAEDRPCKLRRYRDIEQFMRALTKGVAQHRPTQLEGA